MGATRSLGSLATGALLLAGCGAPVDGGAGGSDERRDPAAETMPEDEGDAECASGSNQEQPPMGPGDFDREEAKERAEAFLGVTQEDAEPKAEDSGSARIVRRGDERLPVTMDLQPGRLNLELDENDAGTYVVTRVVVEVPDDQDPLVVE